MNVRQKISKALCLLIALAMLVSIAACGEGGDTTSVGDTSEVAEPSSSVISTVSLEESAVSDISMPSSEEESNEEELSETEESSEESIDEPSEPEESSEEESKVILSYDVEDEYFNGFILISRTVKGVRKYGLASSKGIVLAPIYEFVREIGARDARLVIAVEDLRKEGDALVYKNGKLVGKYSNAMPQGGGHTAVKRQLCEFGIFAKDDGSYFIIGDDGLPLYDDITHVYLPNYMKENYVYFDTADGKHIIAELYIIYRDSGYGTQYTLRYYEVEDIDEYTEKNFPLMLEVGEKFITAMANKDEEVIRECMTENLYNIFKTPGNEYLFQDVYGMPRISDQEHMQYLSDEDKEWWDRCNGFPFARTWVNPLPGTMSLVEYPFVLPYVQMWMIEGEGGVWRVADVQPESEV